MPTLNEARIVNAMRERLRGALRTGDLYLLREEVITLLADTGSGRVLSADVDQAADTLRSVHGPDFEPDSAPPVPLERPSGGP